MERVAARRIVALMHDHGAVWNVGPAACECIAVSPPCAIGQAVKPITLFVPRASPGPTAVIASRLVHPSPKPVLSTNFLGGGGTGISAKTPSAPPSRIFATAPDQSGAACRALPIVQSGIKFGPAHPRTARRRRDRRKPTPGRLRGRKRRDPAAAARAMPWQALAAAPPNP